MAAINEGSFSRRLAVALAILAVSGMVYYYLAILLPHTRATNAHPTIGRYSFGNDFYPVWLTSRECFLQRLDPYSLSVTHKIQAGIFGDELSSSSPDHPPAEYREFAYPAFADIFGLPVAWLPFSMARIVVAITFILMTPVSVFLWFRGLDWTTHLSTWLIFTMLTLSSYQGLEALYALQPGLIVFFLLAATMAALSANRLHLAGFLLAFSTIKPQVSALLVLYFLFWAVGHWQERRKFALTFLITLVALYLGAMLVWPGWMVGWEKAITRYPGYYSRPSLLGMLIVGLAGTLVFAWNNRREEPASFRFGLTVSLLLSITTVTILPQHAVYDQIILLPAIMILVRSWRTLWGKNSASKVVVVLGAIALFWQWIAAPVVGLVQFVEPHLALITLLLPLRTASAIPFVVVALLFLMIRCGKQRQRLAEELS